MDAWQAVVLGLVEGITEYLPVSSTGHLIIASAFLGLDDPELKSSIDAFNIAIQGGAILAVLGLYRRRVWQMILGLLGRDPAGLRLAMQLFVAFLPAAVIGVLANDAIEAWLFHPGPVIAALMLGGVYMILLERWRTRRRGPTGEPREGEGLESLTLRKAFIIGLFQCVAMWPGTSRSMMTITGGVVVGLRPVAAAEFSFLLGLPTLGGATVYRVGKDMMEGGQDGTTMFDQLGVMPIVIGIATATVSAALAVKWLVGYLNRNGLTPFGVYRLLFGAALLGLVAGGVIQFGPEDAASDGADHDAPAGLAEPGE